MSGIVKMIHRLLNEGSLVLSRPPSFAPEECAPAVDLLRQAHEQLRREVAGAPLPFDADLALAAARLVCRAGWLLLARDEPPEAVEKALRFPQPATAAQHLSADLMLRFLAGVQRRARAIQPDDVLTRSLAVSLRQWPLSGVLADVEEGPLTSCDFQGHAGLMLLYAERLADHRKPAWVPREGPGREWTERVFAERGLPMDTDQGSDRRGT